MEFHQLQRPGAGAADAVVEALPRGGLARMDLVGPQQVANPQPSVVEVSAAEQRAPAPVAVQGPFSRIFSNGLGLHPAAQLYSPGRSCLLTVTRPTFWPEKRSSSSPEKL
jgi:hypothetical protein